MRALMCEAYGAPEDLVLKDIDPPSVGPGQVRIAVKAAAINFPDVLVIAGKYQVKTPPPFVPGSEGAGVVDAVGEGVKHFSVGDEVIYGKYGGSDIEVDGDEVKILRESDILAKVLG